MLLRALLGSRVYIFPIRPCEAHSAGRSSCICRVIKVSVRVVSLPGIPLNCRIIMCLYLEEVAVGHPLRKSPVAACSLPLHPNLNHWPPLCDKRWGTNLSKLDPRRILFQTSSQVGEHQRWCASKCSAAATLLSPEWPHVAGLDHCLSFSHPISESDSFTCLWRQL